MVNGDRPSGRIPFLIVWVGCRNGFEEDLGGGGVGNGDEAGEDERCEGRSNTAVGGEDL